MIVIVWLLVDVENVICVVDAEAEFFGGRESQLVSRFIGNLEPSCAPYRARASSLDPTRAERNRKRKMEGLVCRRGTQNLHPQLNSSVVCRLQVEQSSSNCAIKRPSSDSNYSLGASWESGARVG